MSTQPTIHHAGQAARTIAAGRRYLHLPIRRGAAKRPVQLWAGATLLLHVQAELTAEKPDFLAVLDAGQWSGQELTLTLPDAPDAAPALAAITPSDAWPDNGPTYLEARRPQFHFTSRIGWVNDPNGLVFHNGVYHLFYQHNPYGVTWGNMTWGHAGSADLVHWQEEGDVLHPDALGAMYSGSAVLDTQNSSGLGSTSAPPLAVFYTAAGGAAPQSLGQPFTQCLAASSDGGRSWRKYPGNPIVPHLAGHNRDPKVFWHPPSQRWVMALYLEKQGDLQRFALLSSPDLKQWTQTSELLLPGSGECPDLFELPVVAAPGQSRWIFWAADGHYFIGDFDGRSFAPQTPPLYAYAGSQPGKVSAYAAQTFSSAPSGRCIQIAWLRGDIADSPFNQQMAFPVELSLRPAAAGLRLHFAPVAQLHSLAAASQTLRNVEIAGGSQILPGSESGLMHVLAQINAGSASHIHLRAGSSVVTWDVNQATLACGPVTAPLPAGSARMLDLELLLDRQSLELFAAGGSVYLPLQCDLAGCSGLTVQAQGGIALFDRVEIRTLKSAWPTGGYAGNG